jgi:hypothetical protein
MPSFVMARPPGSREARPEGKLHDWATRETQSRKRQALSGVRGVCRANEIFCGADAPLLGGPPSRAMTKESVL